MVLGSSVDAAKLARLASTVRRPVSALTRITLSSLATTKERSVSTATSVG
jgi:hypothetical protein